MSVRMISDNRRPYLYITAGDVPGLIDVSPWNIVGRMRLSTEALDVIDVTLSGVKVGSEIHIFDYLLSEIVGTESATDPHTFQLSRYSEGNPLNNVRILIASLGYENIDLSYTVPTSDATIPIVQRIDRNYKNP